MSKFVIKVELQGLKIEVEGTKEDAPRIAKQLGQQIGNLFQTTLEKEKVKGANATVGADTTEGTSKYFLTRAGTAMAERLARGEAVAATAD